MTTGPTPFPPVTALSLVVWAAADAALTRPNNATAYAAHQGIGSGSSCIFKWSDCFRTNGGTGLLTGLRLEASVASIAAANMGAITARLFNTSPSSPPSADQQTFNTLVANSPIELGAVDFATWSIGGAGSDVIRSYGVSRISPMQLKAAAAAKDLYMVLEATAAFTPAANAIINAYASALLD
jgi:hypothetical protein